MNKNILILGATGMLGNALFSELSKYKNFEVKGTVRRKAQAKKLPKNLQNKILANIDVQDLRSLRHAFQARRPDVIINCVAYIKEPQNDQEKALAISLNSLFPHQLAELAKNAGARLIHMSTDSALETDFYSRTKFLGEVDANHCLTIRSSIIGHGLENQNSLVDWFLNQKKKVEGYKKMIFSGFPTVELARIIAKYIIPNKKLSGIYHISSRPISKYDLLKIVARVYKKKIVILANYDIVLDRSLNSSKFRQATGYRPPSWEKLIVAMFQYYQTNPNFVKY